MGRPRIPAIAGICAGLIVVGAIPILFRFPPAPTGGFFNDETEFRFLGYLLLVGIVGGAMYWAARLDPERGTQKTVRLIGFAIVAAFATDIHYYTVDLLRLKWQVDQFNGILTHTAEAPDQYRFLPQGILWWMLLPTGDFLFSYVAYRFLFTFIVCEVIYLLARLYLSPRDSVIAVLVYALFYPMSARYAWGNLLDPMSHATILGVLLLCHYQQFWNLLFVFTLGMFVKETTIITVPCYWLLNVGKLPTKTIASRTGILVAVGIAVFLVCRLPFNFDYGLHSLNRTYGLMVRSNLGIENELATSPISVFQRYLQPMVFIFAWLPFLIWQRKRLPQPLFFAAVYLALASYAVNLLFSWNYESRNFVPALVVLIVATLIAVNRMFEPKVQYERAGA